MIRKVINVDIAIIPRSFIKFWFIENVQLVIKHMENNKFYEAAQNVRIWTSFVCSFYLWKNFMRLEY